MKALSVKKPYLFLFSVFFLVYSIIGIIIHDVNILYLYLSLLYLVLSVLVFKYFFSKKTKIKGERNFSNTVENLIQYKNQIIFLYFFLFTIQFIFPKFRLYDLLNPIFDFQIYYQSKFSEQNIISTLIHRTKELIFPLFLISLSKIKLKNAVFFLILNLYFGFALRGYVGRGAFVILFITIMYGVYYYNKKLFKRVMFVFLLLAPLIFWSFIQFSRIRLGVSFLDLSVLNSYELISRAETMTSYYGEIAIQGNNSSMVIDYIKWIISLPIPSQLLPFKPMELNYIIAEDIHGFQSGEVGFTVTLIGLFFESLYVFGSSFFIIHLLILQFLIALLFNIAKIVGNPVFLTGTVLAQATYVLNRAGTAAFYPFAINTLILILFIYIFSILSQKSIRIK